MMGRRWLLAVVLPALWAVPAPADLFAIFKKKTGPSPTERVAQLIGTLKTDSDEKKREAAAEELRSFDPRTYPEVMSVLIEALQQDPRPAVRLEAARSLGRLRPVSTAAGQALEQAADRDAALRVRLQAQSSLLYYRVSGYRTPGKPADAALVGKRLTPVPAAASPPLPAVKGPALPTETAPPPLAVPEPPVPQALPQPRFTPLPAPVVPPRSPALKPDQGPDLTPPG